jgi:hypothetical protein
MGDAASVQTPEGKKVEMVFMNASMERNNSLPPAWGTSIESRIIGTDGTYINVYRLAKGDYFIEHKHVPHGVDFSGDICDSDIHYMITSSTTGTIKLKLSLYHMYEGRSCSGLSPDFVGYRDVEVVAGVDIDLFKAAFVANAIDLTSWQANRTIHDEVVIRFERLDIGDGDTYAGDIDILHGEIFSYETGIQWHGN